MDEETGNFKRRSSHGHGESICTVSEAFGELVRGMVDSHAYRCWIIDGDGAPYGILSLRDALQDHSHW